MSFFSCLCKYRSLARVCALSLARVKWLARLRSFLQKKKGLLSFNMAPCIHPYAWLAVFGAFSTVSRNLCVTKLAGHDRHVHAVFIRVTRLIYSNDMILSSASHVSFLSLSLSLSLCSVTQLPRDNASGPWPTASPHRRNRRGWSLRCWQRRFYAWSCWSLSLSLSSAPFSFPFTPFPFSPSCDSPLPPNAPFPPAPLQPSYVPASMSVEAMMSERWIMNQTMNNDE